jgi:hypothetical protein
MLSACSADQINTFISACTGPSSSMADCGTFEQDQNNFGCLTCLFGSDDGGTSFTGALLPVNGGTTFTLNTPGCVDLEDPDNGAACAQKLEPLVQCEALACGSAACQAASAADQEACATASYNGACASELSAAAPCQVDFADGGTGSALCGTAQQVLNAICGTGMN